MKNRFFRLTENQALFILETHYGDKKILRGHGLGRIAKTVEDMGFVKRVGRRGRRIKWRMNTKLSTNDIEWLKRVSYE